jgi:hypothetical protein
MASLESNDMPHPDNRPFQEGKYSRYNLSIGSFFHQFSTIVKYLIVLYSISLFNIPI